MLSKLEEYMIFETNDGYDGVILKNNNLHSSSSWNMCFRNCEGGQVFSNGDNHYKNISKLYTCAFPDDKKYYAFKYMMNKDLDYYFCIYDKDKKVKKVVLKRPK